MVSDRLGGGARDPFAVTSRLFLPASQRIQHLDSRIRRSFSTIMAITDFLATSDITSAINACKGQEAAALLISVKERKKEKCCFQEDVRAFNAMLPFKTN